MEKSYKVRNVDLNGIRNRNEVRVIKLMNEVLADFPDFQFEKMDLEDIYALTLNHLPGRYVQRGSIVLREDVSNEEIKDKIRESVKVVYDNPKYNL